MKKRISGLLIILFLTTINFACVRHTVVVVQPKKDNGKHKGWYKNPKNPHHPAHARNSGGGHNTTVIINNSNSKGKPSNGNGHAHANAKPGNGKGNASKGHGGGNGKGKK